MSKVMEEFFPDAGCRYFKGFCVMCPFTQCLQQVKAPKRKWLLRRYVIRILWAQKVSPYVIQIALDTSNRTIKDVLRKK